MDVTPSSSRESADRIAEVASWLAPRRSPAAEDEAADREPEPEGADRERSDRDELPPEREALPASDRLLLLRREGLAATLLPHGSARSQTEIDVVEQLGRLVRHGSSV